MTNPAVPSKFMEDKLIKNEIPELLAKLVLNDQKDEALKLLIAWGTHEKDNKTIWDEAKNALKNA